MTEQDDPWRNDEGGEPRKMVPAEDYPVGYGKPPRQHQFKPGRSGNPKGRPKGAKSLRTELREELDEWVTISVDGKPRRIRKRRLVVKALTSKAAKGHVPAADRVVALMIQMEGLEDDGGGQRLLSSNDQLILDQFLAEGDASEERDAIGEARAASPGDEGDPDGAGPTPDEGPEPR